MFQRTKLKTMEKQEDRGVQFSNSRKRADPSLGRIRVGSEPSKMMSYTPKTSTTKQRRFHILFFTCSFKKKTNLLLFYIIYSEKFLWTFEHGYPSRTWQVRRDSVHDFDGDKTNSGMSLKLLCFYYLLYIYHSFIKTFQILKKISNYDINN